MWFMFTVDELGNTSIIISHLSSDLFHALAVKFQILVNNRVSNML